MFKKQQSNNIGEENNDPKEEASKIIEFILKLAEYADIDEKEIIDTIVKQIEEAEYNTHFTDIINTIDPESFSFETKVLGDQARDRLNEAITQYRAKHKS